MKKPYEDDLFWIKMGVLWLVGLQLWNFIEAYSIKLVLKEILSALH
jgi:hypothetical protein